MSDIVRDPYGNPLNRDKLITALRAENEKLRAALERLSCDCPSNCDWEKHNDICPSWVARAALGGKDE